MYDELYIFIIECEVLFGNIFGVLISFKLVLGFLYFGILFNGWVDEFGIGEGFKFDLIVDWELFGIILFLWCSELSSIFCWIKRKKEKIG